MPKKCWNSVNVLIFKNLHSQRNLCSTAYINSIFIIFTLYMWSNSRNHSPASRKRPFKGQYQITSVFDWFPLFYISIYNKDTKEIHIKPIYTAKEKGGAEMWSHNKFHVHRMASFQVLFWCLFAKWDHFLPNEGWIVQKDHLFFKLFFSV